jgi:hypothetical protein
MRVRLLNLCAAPKSVCLQEHMLHLCMSVYQSFVLRLRLSVYKSFVLHLDVSAYKQESSICTVHKIFFGSFRFFSKQIVFSVVSIRVRNTETNRKIIFLVSRNKPKNNRNRLCFVSFRFKPKIFFVCFEDTLSTRRHN